MFAGGRLVRGAGRFHFLKMAPALDCDARRPIEASRRIESSASRPYQSPGGPASFTLRQRKPAVRFAPGADGLPRSAMLHQGQAARVDNRQPASQG